MPPDTQAPTFLVLPDATCQTLLETLSRPEVVGLQNRIASALQTYSLSPSERSFQPASAAIVRPTGQKTLFRPFTSASAVGTKIIVDPAPPEGSPSSSSSSSSSRGPLRGVVAVCDRQGFPRGVLNAATLTGVRTTLSALIPFTWRARVARIVVFGAGTQALWHVRLALKLRGDEIEEVVVVNRSVERARELVEKVRAEREGTNIRWLDAQDEGYDEELKRKLWAADVVFCTVPSKQPLFRSEDVKRDTTGKCPLITAIGSWTPDMMELPPELLRGLAADEAAFHPTPAAKAEKGKNGGAIIVDDRDSVSQHAGEVVESGIGSEALVEIGEVLDLQQRDESDPAGRRAKWLQHDFLVYKSVGVSLTDLVTAEAILDLAQEKGLGVSVPEF